MPHRRAGFAIALLLWPTLAAAQDRTVDLLQKMTHAAGAPGFEEPIRKVMLDAIKPFAASVAFDGLGSILATQGTSGPRIMVDVHMDELGGVIRRVTPRGLLAMQMFGGWLDQALVDQRLHNGIINRRDFDQMVDVVVALLQKLDAAAVEHLRDFTPER